MSEFEIDDISFSDGSKGTLGIALFDDKKKLPHTTDVEAKEEAMKEQGINYKQIALTSDYLDDWKFDFRIMPKSLEQKSLSGEVAKVTEKQGGIVQLFPEFAASNKDKMFNEFVAAYGDSSKDYAPPAKAPPSDLEQLLGNSESLTGNDAPPAPPQQ